ncbi:MAG: YkgJ family cysteine cluster protein [Desulfovibrionaceae bacterium]
MALDFSPFFQQYEALAREIDAVFAKVQAKHAGCVSCGEGCDDCCYALFDLSLIEAMYLNYHFHRKYSGMERDAILDRADEADRESYKIKKKIFKASQSGGSTADILAEVARTKVRCPLLNAESRCDLYDHRPITCRVYGIPTAFGGESRTCGKSGFVKGEAYPTVNVEAIQDRLMQLSLDLVSSIATRHKELHTVLVPVSMALLTNYDHDYLGLVGGSNCSNCGHSWTIGGDSLEPITPAGAGCRSCPSAAGCAAEVGEQE